MLPTLCFIPVIPTLYTVPNAPDPTMVPFLSSDSLMILILAMSGFASVGVRGCKYVQQKFLCDFKSLSDYKYEFLNYELFHLFSL